MQFGRYNKYRQRDVKNSTGNGEAKELLYMTHGHELRERLAGGNGVPGGGQQRGKIGTNVIAKSIKYIKK